MTAFDGPAYSAATWEGLGFAYTTVDGRAFERAVFTKLGFDCRAGCTHACHHKTKGKPPPAGSNYGWEGDEHMMVVRFEDGVGRITFFSSFLDGAVMDSPSLNDGPKMRPAYLDYCFAFPTDEDDVRSGKEPSRCPHQRKGHCYPTGAMYLAADDLCKPHEPGLALVTNPDPACAAAQLLQCERLSDDLARRLLNRYERAVQAHAELPTQCPTCAGAGVVPK